MTAIEGTAAAAGSMPDRPAAAKSSFYVAMRILPRSQREAMYAVYAFCRAVDDIADGDLPREAKLRELRCWREAIETMHAGGASPAELAFFAGEGRGFGLRRDDFLAVVDGMEMDANGPVRMPDERALDLYCDRVASAVGRLSNRIFGIGQPAADQLAHHLGRALQLTNILRDLDEDAELGRLYLPREVLADSGVDTAGKTIEQILAQRRIDCACRVLAGRAAEHFAEAGRIMDAQPRAQVKAPRLMAAAYSDILRRLRREGWKAPRPRLSMNKPKLALAALRYGLF